MFDHRRCLFEPLETRLAMTGLQASQAFGVLGIAGSADDDTITLRYDTTQVTIVELGQSFALKGLVSIEITTGNGDDTIQFEWAGAKKPKWIGMAVTARADGGDDQLIDALNSTTYFGGEADLEISRSGKVRIDGEKISWFDETLADTALRELAESQFNDKILSRDDMLALFDEASDDDCVSTSEFDSLQALAENRPLFKKLEDVWTLTSYVVMGTDANAKFQHHSLGNLEPGSDGDHLQSLVDKWFRGLDYPLACDPDTGQSYNYAAASGTLFVDGPSYEDIRQGNLGDCYLLAGLGAIAVHSPKQIASMFSVNGDGTYTIRYFDDETPYYITVDSQLPVNSAGRFVFASAGNRYDSASNELWVPLAEKAYAQLAEFGWLDTGNSSALNAYSSIDAGWPGDATGQATGQEVIDLLVLDNPSVISKAFAADRAITFITSSLPASPDVISNHVYAMVGYDKKTKEFLLFNPWGLNNGSVPGLLSYTWEEMQANFYSWDYGPKV